MGVEEMGSIEDQISKCNKDPISNDCMNCTIFKECWEYYMKLDVRIPFFIVDRYLPILSRHATNILLFLARKANFDPSHRNFGRCWATHEQVVKNTNVPKSNMRRYTSELVRHGLISKVTTVKKSDDGKFYTINEYSVSWIRKIQELKEAVK